ncbi:MAG: hypothetical protein LBP81_10280 [Treponema sp.]|jgi:hypothetical protein|nr:hypothetical protein [Treponema sp.]
MKPVSLKASVLNAAGIPAGLLWVLLLFPIGTDAAAADFADSVTFSGETETLFAFPFSADRDLTEARTGAKALLGAYIGEAEARITFNAEYNPVIPSRTGAALDEAWIRWNPAAGRTSLSLSLGCQRISWGAADGLILTDVVCPQNLVSYAGLDFAGSRLPVDGVSVRLGISGFSFGDFSAEVLWLPVFIPAKLPLENDNPLNALLFPSGIIPVTAAGIQEAKPNTITGGEYGLRVSCYTPLFDLSLCGFYGWNDIPYLRGSAAGPPPFSMTPEFHRTIMAGGDASIPADNFLFRLEAAYTWGGRFTPDEAAIAAALGNLVPVEKTRLQMLAGMDWNPGSWTVTVQYCEDLLPAKDGGIERDWRKNGTTLSVSRSFLRGVLTVSSSCYLGLRDFDAAGSGEIRWAVTGALELFLGTDFFFGGIDGRGDYAAYRDLSCLWFGGIYRF